MRTEDAPAEVLELAESRARARRAYDWPTADRLKAEIEAAGWKVIDAGTLYSLEPARPPDVVEGGVVRYGSSAAVPSRLDEPATGVATVVVETRDRPADLALTLDGLAATAPAGTAVVVVANGVPAELVDTVERIAGSVAPASGIEIDLVRTAGRIGHAAALNAGIRRAAAPVVLLLDAGTDVRGDLVSAVVAALEDPEVGVAGPFGLVSRDLRLFDAPTDGRSSVDAVAGAALAFRRADYVERGPLDERFADDPYLDAWWSLVLRDQEDGEEPPRRAFAVSGVDVAPPAVSDEGRSDEERERRRRKGHYRLLKRFPSRYDLLGEHG